ncbi:histone-lysine N-methyltransferase ATXR6-like isoform X2 [Tripterygium wilfordii]|uniref:Histone-lysine N-methyltransferase ATXR6-like isoform X2 n=1 Tax=Tripterygium wilfordii TaxID=458696 RepID=A0A7J7CED6_TRIWF|nr:histone-lysine N-methyltransferase ATXR6-like isoform X2 [Tripterygium wilfordii]
MDFFQIQRSPDSIPQPSQDNQRKRKQGVRLLLTKKRRKLLSFNPCEDSNRRLQQMASLATALTASGADFSNELT